MRLRIAICHFHRDSGGHSPEGRWHGSLASAGPRVSALTACVSALQQLYGPAQRVIDQTQHRALPANNRDGDELEVVICTTGGHHVLDRLPLPKSTYRHHATKSEPELLGFACHEVLAAGIGAFDYFGYLEDDLICRDPWMFEKLRWFSAHLGRDALLQPNRYEVCLPGFVPKAYIDGEIARELTAPFQDQAVAPEVASTVLGMPVRFARAANPHSGCFFLNAEQMSHWAAQPYFGDRDTSFIGPLESAATLGVMKTFRVYKPVPENASFLEIEHHGNGFISQLRRG